MPELTRPSVSTLWPRLFILRQIGICLHSPCIGGEILSLRYERGDKLLLSQHFHNTFLTRHCKYLNEDSDILCILVQWHFVYISTQLHCNYMYTCINTASQAKIALIRGNHLFCHWHEFGLKWWCECILKSCLNTLARLYLLNRIFRSHPAFSSCRKVGRAYGT